MTTMKKFLTTLKFYINKLKYPENVWYGGSLKRETALDSVGDGWSPIINNLYDAKPRNVKVNQVKEKWGGLRFYVSYAPEWYADLIDFYEHESYTTCERCGKKGKLREDLSWMSTLCDEHYEKEKK